MKPNRSKLRVEELERRENPSVAAIDVPIDCVPTIVTCYAAPQDAPIDQVPTIVTCYAAPQDVPIGEILIESGPWIQFPAGEWTTVPEPPPFTSIPPGYYPTPPPVHEIYKDDTVVGANGIGSSRVRSIKPDGTERLSFNAFESSFTGGITVATADFNDDGVKDIIVGAGFGGGPRVIGFDGLTGRELFSFYAFDADYTGGVSVATGDVNFDQTVVLTVQGNMIIKGQVDIIVGALHGSSHVKVFDESTLSEISSFYAFEGFQGA